MFDARCSSACVAVAVLAGCGGTSEQTATSGETRQCLERARAFTTRIEPQEFGLPSAPIDEALGVTFPLLPAQALDRVTIAFTGSAEHAQRARRLLLDQSLESSGGALKEDDIAALIEQLGSAVVIWEGWNIHPKTQELVRGCLRD